ncbi:hypothetical protein V5R04_09280 [Jonesiaceae bacterium BS-20]|uniref:Uncharacterized protein n=1 Tax=Jonesiaceae bacterium BS-20 TaxID=3120821 RepID=A0AAU7DSY1_9MICO
MTLLENRTRMNGVTWQGIPAFFIVGTGIYYLGRHLNVTGPTKKLAAMIAQYNEQAGVLASPSINHAPTAPLHV